MSSHVLRVLIAAAISLLLTGCIVSPGFHSSGGFAIATTQPGGDDAEGAPERPVYLSPSKHQPIVLGSGTPGAKLAVVELGEPKPPRGAVARLQRTKLFESVEALDGGPDVHAVRDTMWPEMNPGVREHHAWDQWDAIVRRAVNDATGRARSSGATYLLVLTSYARSGTPESIAGVPKEERSLPIMPFRVQQHTKGSAGAVLIDVSDGAAVHGWLTDGFRSDLAQPRWHKDFGQGYAESLGKSLVVKVAGQAAETLAAEAKTADVSR